MFNKTLFGTGFAGTIAMHFGISIVSIFSFLSLAIELFLTFPFRWLIVESYLNCNSLPVKFWFRKPRRKPPDSSRNPSLLWFRFGNQLIVVWSHLNLPSFKSNIHHSHPFLESGTLRLLNVRTKTHFETRPSQKHLDRLNLPERQANEGEEIRRIESEGEISKRI